MRISDWSSDVCSSDLYAKTFKSGGINQNGVPNGADGDPILAAATVKPELVDHYEAGVKTEFWDRRVTLNLRAFRTDLRNFQASVNNGQFGVRRGYHAIAGKHRPPGGAIAVSARLSERGLVEPREGED